MTDASVVVPVVPGQRFQPALDGADHGPAPWCPGARRHEAHGYDEVGIESGVQVLENRRDALWRRIVACRRRGHDGLHIEPLVAAAEAKVRLSGARSSRVHLHVEAEPRVHLMEIELPKRRVELEVLLRAEATTQVVNCLLALQPSKHGEPVVERVPYALKDGVVYSLEEPEGGLCGVPRIRIVTRH